MATLDELDWGMVVRVPSFSRSGTLGAEVVGFGDGDWVNVRIGDEILAVLPHECEIVR